MKFIGQLIQRALDEDTTNLCITTNFLVPSDSFSEAYIVVKEDAVLCGLDIVKRIFNKIHSKIQIHGFHHNGDAVKKGTTVLHLKGNTRVLLKGERVALNFLAYLSGISTITNAYVKKVYPYKIKIMDTRKTTPGLRKLEKMAVRFGGGVNHRFTLNEMVLIKDNHIIAKQKDLSLQEAIKKIRKKTSKTIGVEVDTLAQLKNILPAHPDFVLLDNMSIKEMKEAVKLNKKNKRRCLLEASGGITLKNVREVAKTGVDRISIGAITHSPKAIDFSMEFKTQ